MVDLYTPREITLIELLSLLIRTTFEGKNCLPLVSPVWDTDVYRVTHKKGVFCNLWTIQALICTLAQADQSRHHSLTESIDMAVYVKVQRKS